MKPNDLTGIFLAAAALILASHARAQLTCASGEPIKPEKNSLVFESREKTMTLCGKSEFAGFVSSPPKKYRSMTVSGGLVGPGYSTLNPIVIIGVATYFGTTTLVAASCDVPPAGATIRIYEIPDLEADYVEEPFPFDFASPQQGISAISAYIGATPPGYDPLYGGRMDLSDEDTEAAAAARAVAVVGTSPTAFRTTRGDTFAWSTAESKYSARFKIDCPGDYDIHLAYEERPHGLAAPVTKYEVVERRTLEKGTRTVSGSVQVRKDNIDYTVTGIELRAPCSGNPVAGASDISIGSVRVRLSLGQGTAGFSAGEVRLQSDDLADTVYAPDALVMAVGSDGKTEIIRNLAGAPRQVKAPQSLADIVTLTATSYEIRFYDLTAVGVQDSVTKIYAVGGAPFVTYRLENPGSAQVQVKRLRITETRGATTKVNDYAYDSGAATWSLNRGNGLPEESLAVVVSGADTVKTSTIKDGNGVVVGKSRKTYRSYPWGEELVEEVRDPDGAALTSTSVFYTDAATDGANYGRLFQRTHTDGSWERTTWDAAGRSLKTIRPFLAAVVGSAENLCRVGENNYGTVPDADGDGIDEELTTTVERTLGQETSRRYRIDWSKSVTLGLDVCKRRSDIVCVSAGAVWNAPANLVTETLRHDGGVFADRSRRIINPDGTVALTSYNVAADGALTSTFKSGQPNAAKDDIVDGRRTISITSATGQMTGETVTDIASGLVVASWTAAEFDAVGRPTRIEYSDGTLVTRSYACCGLASERDRSGLVTTYAYDALGRQIAVTRAGLTTRTAYDAEGRVLSTTRVGSDGSEMVQSSTTYDSAGRIISTRDALLRTTTFAEAFDASTGRVTRTTTSPGGGTVIEVSARDGSRLSVTGTAAAPHTFDYGVDATGAYVQDTSVGLDANNQPTATEWVKRYTDFAGRSFRTVFAGGAVEQSYFNAFGQLIRQVDPDGVTTLFAYNARGEQNVVAVDLNANGVIDYAGLDRVTKTVGSVATKTDGGTYTVQRTATQVWETDNQDSPVTVSLSEQSTDGLRSWQTARGLISKSVTTLDGSGGRTVITTAPDGVQSVQVYTNGRLVSTLIKTAANVQLAASTSTYDAHGRTLSVSDARNGATTFTYFADDQLKTVTTPDPDSTRSGVGYDAQTTTYAYDSAGRTQTITQPDGAVVNTTYWPTGAVKRTWGARTYPIEYTYDSQGRVKTLTTWRNFSGDTGKAITTWNYDAARGLLLNKRHADNTGPSYTYKPSGRVLTRTWARTPAITTTYGYTAAGDLITTVYSDTTPGVTLAFDRSGRPKSITDGAGSRTLAYHVSGQLEDETYTAGLLSGFVLDRSFDSLHRPGGVSALNPQSVALSSATYAYDTASRLDTVTSGANTATYRYLANSPLIETVAFKNAGTTRLTATKTYDKLNRLAASSAQFSAGATLGHGYVYNAANQRTRATREDNAYWSYGYDALGQVTSGSKFLVDATPALGLAHAYAYDDIGNRTTTTINGQTATYTANALNQYGQRTVPATVDVSGAAAASATVTVQVNNGAPQPTVRQGEAFHRQLAVDNAAAAQNPTVTITGVKNLAGPNGEDVVTQLTKTAFLARTPETFTHDTDGNLTADARWHYTWDAENRLVAMETNPLAVPAGVPRQKLEFVYDGQGRRLAKRIHTWNPTALAYQLSTEMRFLYDGWNLLAEFAIGAPTSTLNLVRSHVWGLDLSGSMQGAGGVGGLLMVNDFTSAVATHFAVADGNGNTAGLVRASDGTLTAKYDYNAFGETVAAEGAFAVGNPFRFSTKYTDDETGYLYYGFRYYSPEMGRWINRDPSGETGGVGLFTFNSNNALSYIDPFGLSPFDSYFKISRAIDSTKKACSCYKDVVTRLIVLQNSFATNDRNFQRAVADVKEAFGEANSNYKEVFDRAEQIAKISQIVAMLNGVKKLPAALDFEKHLLEMKSTVAYTETSKILGRMNKILAVGGSLSRRDAVDLTLSVFALLPTEAMAFGPSYFQSAYRGARKALAKISPDLFENQLERLAVSCSDGNGLGRAQVEDALKRVENQVFKELIDY